MANALGQQLYRWMCCYLGSGHLISRSLSGENVSVDWLREFSIQVPFPGRNSGVGLWVHMTNKPLAHGGIDERWVPFFSLSPLALTGVLQSVVPYLKSIHFPSNWTSAQFSRGHFSRWLGKYLAMCSPGKTIIRLDKMLTLTRLILIAAPDLFFISEACLCLLKAAEIPSFTHSYIRRNVRRLRWKPPNRLAGLPWQPRICTQRAVKGYSTGENITELQRRLELRNTQ